ncbi:MAG TPA: GNAT family N-acetyltransferase [Polyangiaceae bacterium]|nr:GNAT family N-acetyltransferase [Polyangiaceae bacterium]
MPGALAVQALSCDDLARNVALSNSVGWPDSESEWAIIYEAARVLGVNHGSELVAQGALGLFEGAASIAKMVVAKSAQRQGLGGQVLDALLAEADRRSLARVGLVATPAGQRLYESRGFVPVREVAILVGTPTISGESSGSASIADLEQLLRIERQYTGSARAAVLSGRLRQASASAICSDGFALATSHPSGSRIGPIFAENEHTARRLTRDLLLRLTGPVRFDVPGEQQQFRRWLQQLGLVEKGLHLEMARGGALPWAVAQRFGLATQAWG